MRDERSSGRLRRRACSAQLLASCTLLGCATATPAPPLPAPLTEVQRLIGDARCNRDADCRTIAVGYKACGGPAYYLAWSTLGTDPKALADAAARQAAHEREQQTQSPGRVSNCAFVGEPEVSCRGAASSSPGAVGGATGGRCELAGPASVR